MPPKQQVTRIFFCIIQRFALTVHLVKKVTSSCLMQRLKVKGRRNPDHSRALSKWKMTP